MKTRYVVRVEARTLRDALKIVERLAGLEPEFIVLWTREPKGSMRSLGT